MAPYVRSAWMSSLIPRALRRHGDKRSGAGDANSPSTPGCPRMVCELAGATPLIEVRVNHGTHDDRERRRAGIWKATAPFSEPARAADPGDHVGGRGRPGLRGLGGPFDGRSEIACPGLSVAVCL